jgi:hypothetical protein
LVTINKPFYDITSPVRPHIATFFAGNPLLRNFFHAPQRRTEIAGEATAMRQPVQVSQIRWFFRKTAFLRGVMTLWQAGGQPAPPALADRFAAHKTGSFT